MHIKKSILSVISLFMIVFVNQTVAFTLRNENNGDPFLKIWTHQVGTKTYTLHIDRNPAESKYPYHVKLNSPCESKYESDACELQGSDVMVCGLFSPAAFFKQLKLHDAQHKITTSDFAGCEFDYYDTNYPHFNIT